MQKERLVEFFGFVEGIHSFEGQCLCGKSLGSPIFFEIGRCVFLECPVGHTVTCSIHASQQTHTGWRAHRTGIRLGEYHSLLGHSLHIGRVISLVERCSLGPEGQRCVLPAHIIHHEQDNIGSFIYMGHILRCHGCHWEQCKWQYFFCVHHHWIVLWTLNILMVNELPTWFIEMA